MSSTQPTEQTTQTTPATREQVYALVHAGIAAGLPIPVQTTIKSRDNTCDFFELDLADEDVHAVDRWCAFLNLANATERQTFKHLGRYVICYGVQTYEAASVPGWSVDVGCYKDGGPVDAERTGSDA